MLFCVYEYQIIWTKHSNIIHVGGTYNLQNKSNYINTCDCMLHARHRGETFGLAISEFLFHDKPVISWRGGIDQNHIEIIKGEELLYTDYPTLFNILKIYKKIINQQIIIKKM